MSKKIIGCTNDNKDTTLCKVCSRNFTRDEEDTNLVNPHVVDGVCNGFLYKNYDAKRNGED